MMKMTMSAEAVVMVDSGYDGGEDGSTVGEALVRTERVLGVTVALV